MESKYLMFKAYVLHACMQIKVELAPIAITQWTQ